MRCSLGSLAIWCMEVGLVYGVEIFASFVQFKSEIMIQGELGKVEG